MELRHEALPALFLVIITQICRIVDASATLEVKMEEFKNDANTDSDGNCCDGWGSLCFNDCDPFFIFCLDYYTLPYRSYYDTSACRVFHGQTRDFHHTKNVQFSSNMAGVGNPIKRTFDRWPGSLILKVRSYDDDPDGRHDLIDKLQYVYSPSRPSRTYSETDGTKKVIRGVHGKSLSVVIRSWCDPFWHGSSCSVYCKPKNDASGHYTCHPDSGQRVCMKGWEGGNCEIWKDDCHNQPCQNGGTCHDKFKAYTCTCRPGFTGTNCEINIDECRSDPCQNDGRCVDQENGYSCVCQSPYVGYQCEHEACNVSNPCQNGGTCYDLRQCLCTKEFEGTFCHISKCSNVTCHNGGTCSVGKCTCAKGYTGARCAVDICDHKQCFNDGICFEGTCICNGTGYSGDSCHIKDDYCEPLPCGGNGECVDLPRSYKCYCFAGFTGANCDVVIPTPTPTTLSPTTLASTFNNTPEGLSGIDEPEEAKATMKDNDLLWIILAAIGGAIVLVIFLILTTYCYIRRQKRRRAEEDPYADLTTSPSAMSDFSNPLYDSVENIRREQPQPSQTEAGAAALPVDIPVAPPSYTDSQLAAMVATKPPAYDEKDPEESEGVGAEPIKLPLE